MLPRITPLFLGFLVALPAAELTDTDLQRRFTGTVQPFLKDYCLKCHSGTEAEAQLDFTRFPDLASVVRDHGHWELVLENLAEKSMPPDEAEKFPSDTDRARVIAWLKDVSAHEARKNAGDPGIVLARRLSNAEYNYTIRDLTGVDIRPTREFPVDPANPAGFDNTGESLAMSPALMTKYLQAAREVASHLVLKPDGLAFAPHPMLVETDRDKYCINQIMDFYRRQATDYAAYFEAAWRFKHRRALGQPKATLADVAAAQQVSPKYLATVWTALEEKEKVGPAVKLQAMWRALPAPKKGVDAPGLRAGCEQMRDYVVQLRRKLEPRFTDLSVKGIGATSQPFRMWLNRQYATHRRSYEVAALQIDGLVKAGTTADPDLFVPAKDRARHEAAFARFCAVFPDAFYMAERGRNQLDTTKDRGRYLSAGFHNIMGYFRDDQPLGELVLDDQQLRELDALWRELDFVASGNIRTFVQFYFNESGEARGTSRESEGARPGDKLVTSPEIIKQVADAYLAKARPSGNDIANRAIAEHFKWVDDGIRWVERARVEAEPVHLDALEKFAARAYRRPLTTEERTDLRTFYRELRDGAGLPHEEAMRDSIVSVLMYPDFCYRIDLVDDGPGIRPLSDYALASRLSYFLWSSMPDDELLAKAAAGELRRPEVLAAQAKRMLADPRVRALATEFGGNWLDFRRFEELNTVDRERFATFDNELRTAMFEEPVRFMVDVFQHNRPVLEFLYADHTFVNGPLAKHYGMTEVTASADGWVRVDGARRYERGGLLPMAAFLTKNAPGLRTSPVKRGYWVVKQVLGEHIPPPPAVVPELPRDEAKADLPLRELLVRHREDKSCASCHARFDSMGLVFEGYGPVGERRTTDLAGRPVDTHADFPGGTRGTGLKGLIDYVRAERQDDFVSGLSRKLLAYGLGRSLQLSDEPTVREMSAKLARDGHRFSSLIESIVTSPQFRTKRGVESVAQTGAP